MAKANPFHRRGLVGLLALGVSAAVFAVTAPLVAQSQTPAQGFDQETNRKWDVLSVFLSAR